MYRPRRDRVTRSRVGNGTTHRGSYAARLAVARSRKGTHSSSGRGILIVVLLLVAVTIVSVARTSPPPPRPAAFGDRRHARPGPSRRPRLQGSRVLPAHAHPRPQGQDGAGPLLSSRAGRSWSSTRSRPTSWTPRRPSRTTPSGRTRASTWRPPSTPSRSEPPAAAIAAVRPRSPSSSSGRGCCRRRWSTQDNTREGLYVRKAKELIQAFKLTQAFPGEEGKKDIITAYLNEIFYGQNAYGIAAAADVYFGKQLNELTIAEAALLAGVPQSPVDARSLQVRQAGEGGRPKRPQRQAQDPPRRAHVRVRAQAHVPGGRADRPSRTSSCSASPMARVAGRP